jgi:ATP-binding cassette subfamily F protein uup
MKMISGEEGLEGEQASIHISKDIRIAYLAQEPVLRMEDTVIDAVFDADHPALQAVKAYENAIVSGSEDEINKSSLMMDDTKAWDIEAKVSVVLAKLRIDYLHQKIASLSGGQRKRVALAKLIIEEPEFLILDEPTNHLDIDMIEWLEDYLQGPNITLLMVTHDRYFLERVCNEILELDRGIVHIYRGNYSQYLEKKEARLQNEAVVFEKNTQLFKRELEWMRRMPQARTTKAKSRIDKFYDIKESIRDKRNEEQVQIMIEPVRLGTKIVEFHNVAKSFGSKKVLTNFTYKFKKAERIGIVGVNGAGKSSFVKLLTGLIPVDTGKIVIGETVQFGYYDQEGLQLKGDKTVIDVIRDIAEYVPLAKGMKLTAETLLERFLFPRSQQRVYVSQLSGGEKRRLYLLTILIKNPNFLILDEPTNDLDIITLNVLEDYLEDYPGCLIVVSHDRYFMDKIVDHLFVIESDGEVIDYNGTYTEYRLEMAEKEAQNTIKHDNQESTTVSESKLTFEQRKEIKAIEKQIEKLEERKKSILLKFENVTLLPANEIELLSKELDAINREIEDKEMAWMELVG